MAAKLLDIPGIGPVKLYKRRRSKSIRLSIASDGQVRVTMPPWLPYMAGVEFAKSKQAWIREHLTQTQAVFGHGDRIGKAHTLVLSQNGAARISTRISGSSIRVNVPMSLPSEHPDIQAAIKTASIRALRSQSEQLLTQRLAELAVQHGFTYRSISIKQLRRRWGSCNSEGDIALNLFLMQLPWELIDYVILHELVHTEVLHHGKEFWDALESVLPNSRRLRTEIKKYQPSLQAQNVTSMA